MATKDINLETAANKEQAWNGSETFLELLAKLGRSGDQKFNIC